MTQLRYTGTSKPKGMVLDVEEKRVRELLNSGEWETIGEKLIVTPKVNPLKQFTKKDDSNSK